MGIDPVRRFRSRHVYQINSIDWAQKGFKCIDSENNIFNNNTHVYYSYSYIHIHTFIFICLPFGYTNT